MLSIIEYAKNTFFHKKREWNKMVERGMDKDFSWKNSAKDYEMLYEKLI